MANLTPASGFTSDIYRIELNDAVQGGENGISNKQAKLLLGNDIALKAMIEENNEVLSRGTSGYEYITTEIAISQELAGKLLRVESTGSLVISTAAVAAIQSGSIFRVLANNAGGKIKCGVGLSGFTYNNEYYQRTEMTLSVGQEVHMWIGNDGSSVLVFSSAPKEHGVPTGALIRYGSVPSLVVAGEWLICNGASFDPNGIYSRLFQAIGNTYGTSGGNYLVPNIAEYMIKT